MNSRSETNVSKLKFMKGRCKTMPPKPKFTKEELIQAALELTREGGLELVVARNLGKKLNTAPSTIFTHFDSVEEIRQAVLEGIWGTVYPVCNGRVKFICRFVYE